MSRYIGKRVSYECGFCKKQFTLNKQSIDDSEKSGEVFCSKQCSDQYYLSDVVVELSDYELDFCENCCQMTNHLDGICQKCKGN